MLTSRIKIKGTALMALPFKLVAPTGIEPVYHA